jgi:methyl-accepting chemotaxis protein
MLAAIAQMRNNLTHIIRDTQQKLSAVVPELTTTAESMRSDMKRQVQETSEVLSATSQFALASQDVARSAVNAASASQDANQRAKQGQLTVNDAMHSNRELASHMGNAADVVMRLDEGSRQITTIVEVIRTIAEQTNLLALNAAIEAARAGEQGRGFAVVADEVRTLAQRTQTATQEIGEIITRLADASQRAVDAIRKGEGLAEISVEKVNHVGNLLETIVESIAIIDTMNAQIASASEEQNVVAQNISGNLQNLSDRATDASLATDQTMHAVKEVNVVVEQLRVMVGDNKR